MKAFFKFLFYTFLFLLIMLIGFVGYSAYYLKATDGKLPSQVIGYIESRLNSLSPEIKIFIGDADVNWHGFKKDIDIIFHDSYIQRNGEVVSSAPDIKATIKVSDLLSASLRFSKISIDSPEFIITNLGDDGSTQPEEADIISLYQKTLIEFVKAIKGRGNYTPLDKFELTNIKIKISDKTRDLNWKIKLADLDFFELQNSFYLRSKIEARLPTKDMLIENEIRLTKNDSVNFKIKFTNLPFRIISGLSTSIAWLGSFNSFSSGEADIIVSPAGAISAVQVKSTIEFEDKNFVNSLIDFTGEYNLVTSADRTYPQIQGKVSVHDIPMNNLARIWPEAFGKSVRNDVITNYRDGVYKNVEIGFKAEADSTEFQNFTSAEFTINGQITSATINFFKNYPLLKNVDGNFTYNGNNLDLYVEKANMGNSIFKNSKIKLLDILNDKSTILEIQGDVSGGLSDLKPLLTAIFEGKDKDYFYNKYKIDSHAETQFFYRDDIANPFETDIVKLDIQSDISDVKIDNIFKGFNLTSKKLLFKINEKGVEIAGNAEINSAPADIDLRYNFFAEEAYELKFTMLINEVTILENVPDLKDYFSGDVDLELSIVNKGQVDFITGKLDLNSAKVLVPILSWKKEIGEFGLISFFGEFKNDAIAINDFQIVAKDGVSGGNAIFSTNKNTENEINFSALNFGRNNASVNIKTSTLNIPSSAAGKKGIITAGNYNVNIVGSTFDFNDYLKLTKYSEQPFGVELRVRTDKAYLANDIELKNVSADLKCIIEYCLSAKASAKFTNDKNIVVEYKSRTENIYGVRDFVMSTDSAENFLKGVDASNNIKGGSLSIVSEVNVEGEQKTKGDITLSDFSLSGTPVLAKIISLASITGILDLLQGEGLSFKKMKGKFEMQDYLVSIQDFRAYGGSLGITAGGMLNLKDSTADISGAVTPAYTVNSLVSNIPLIGKVLTDKEGEGIIATKYRVKGPYADPDVSVNPFSLITPGFLRGIWGDSETDIDKISKKTQKKSRKTTEKPAAQNINQGQGSTSNILSKGKK